VGHESTRAVACGWCCGKAMRLACALGWLAAPLHMPMGLRPTKKIVNQYYFLKTHRQSPCLVLSYTCHGPVEVTWRSGARPRSERHGPWERLLTAECLRRLPAERHTLRTNDKPPGLVQVLSRSCLALPYIRHWLGGCSALGGGGEYIGPWQAPVLGLASPEFGFPPVRCERKCDPGKPAVQVPG
jgi:hypothetical protein